MNEPSRSSAVGSNTRLTLVRPRNWAPRACVARIISKEWKFRSQSSSMPGPTARTRRRPAGVSAARQGRTITSHSACVPVSMTATTRSCG